MRLPGPAGTVESSVCVVQAPLLDTIAWLLSLGNLVAAWFAAQPGEPWHAAIHALLAVLFALGAQRLAARRRPPVESGGADKLRDLEDRLVELEERLDFTERALTDVRARGQIPKQ